jgi:hypothetical protein
VSLDRIEAGPNFKYHRAVWKPDLLKKECGYFFNEAALAPYIGHVIRDGLALFYCGSQRYAASM